MSLNKDVFLENKMSAYFAFIEPKLRPKFVEYLTTVNRDDVTVHGVKDTPHDSDDITVCFVNGSEVVDAAAAVHSRFRNMTVIDLYVDICYAFNLLRNKFTSILSYDDELVALQLCLAEINRKETGVFDVPLVSEVISAKKRIELGRLERLNREKGDSRGGGGEEGERDHVLFDEYERYLDRCNCVDTIHVFNLVRDYSKLNYDQIMKQFRNFIVFDLPFDAIQQRMVEFLVAKRKLFNVTLETPLDTSFSDAVDNIFFEFKIEKWELSDVLTRYNQAPLTSSTFSSVTQMHIERIIMSYLRLLLNTRDEIALAVALSNMVNGFSHEAFTALKRMSKKNSLSMYQNALSYVLKVKLGGKSYAPDRSCPLMQHFAELSTFTLIMNKIQSFVEEELDSKIAFQKILRVVKNHLMKTCCEKLKVEILEKAMDVVETMCFLAVDRQLNQFQWKTQSKEEKCVVIGEKTLLALRLLVIMQATRPSFQHAMSVLADCFSSQDSPMKFPSLLSQFKSPLADSPTDPKPLKVRLRTRENEQPKSKSKKPCNDLSVLMETPPKAKATEKKTVDLLMLNKENTPVTSIVSRPLKRRLNDVSSLDSKQSKKTKRKSNTKPLPKGQQLMTRFFRA